MKTEARIEQRGEEWWVEVTRGGKRQQYACANQRIAERLARLFGEPRREPGQPLQREPPGP